MVRYFDAIQEEEWEHGSRMIRRSWSCNRRCRLIWWCRFELVAPLLLYVLLLLLLLLLLLYQDGKMDKGMQHLCKYLSIVVLLYIHNRLLSLALIRSFTASRLKFTDLAD